MNFAALPANEFRTFFETYFQRCRCVVPKIRVIAAKWAFEDLIPGLSDFDTRFIVDNTMTLDDWHEMSLAVSRVHTDLAGEFRHWARILEHLPGVNLTVDEVSLAPLYCPEFSQWTFYDGPRDLIGTIESTLAKRTWSSQDEIFHLKKIAAYFGPYRRGIDPPINLGVWENKYPLHSRLMHYFAPPVQAMVSIAQRSTVRGKCESLRLARRILPNPQVIDLVFDVINAHYELPSLYVEPALAELERQLARYLSDAWGAIARQVTVIEPTVDDTCTTITEKVQAIPIDDPTGMFFEGAKFGRLMKGRLLFYASNLAWFDSILLIENELHRIVRNLCVRPLQAYALACFDEKLEADTVLECLSGNVLAREEVDGVKRFVALVESPLVKGREKERARAAAEAYEPVLSMLETLIASMRTFIGEEGKSEEHH